MGSKSFAGVNRPPSVLDRASLYTNRILTEAQALTDQLVSVSIQEASNFKTATAMLGAGWVGRFTRIGALSSGRTLSQVIRGISHVPALAAESAAFARIEREINLLEGQKTTQPFQKDWARAAVALTGLKLFGGISRGQNILLQHFFTDLGLIGGHHAAHALGFMEKPQGHFAQQMLQAEALNWSQKGSLALMPGLSSKLLSMEMSLALYLRSRGTHVSSNQVSPFFPRLAVVAEGGHESF